MENGIIMIELTDADQERVVIDIDESVAAMQRRLQERRCGSRRASIYMDNFSSVVCIYRVPESLVGISPKAIRPEKVSIGPYHHSKSKESEETKMKYFEAFLSRKKRDGSAGPDLSTLFKAARNMEAEARRCYDDQAIAMSSAEFVAMMVLDGCFIIELFLQDQEDKLKDVEEKDRLVMDLLKLENQLPFFVLERLFSLSGDSFAPGDSLALLALKFFNVYDHKVLDDVKHLLHLFHSSFHTPLLLERDNTRYQLSNIRSRCVDLLGEADDVMIAYVTTCLSIDSPATAMRSGASSFLRFNPMCHTTKTLRDHFQATPSRKLLNYRLPQTGTANTTHNHQRYHYYYLHQQHSLRTMLPTQDWFFIYHLHCLHELSHQYA